MHINRFRITFQNILHLFLIKNKYILVADRELNPLPPFADRSTTNIFFLLTPYPSAYVKNVSQIVIEFLYIYK